MRQGTCAVVLADVHRDVPSAALGVSIPQTLGSTERVWARARRSPLKHTSRTRSSSFNFISFLLVVHVHILPS